MISILAQTVFITLVTAIVTLLVVLIFVDRGLNFNLWRLIILVLISFVISTHKFVLIILEIIVKFLTNLFVAIDFIWLWLSRTSTIMFFQHRWILKVFYLCIFTSAYFATSDLWWILLSILTLYHLWVWLELFNLMAHLTISWNVAHLS